MTSQVLYVHMNAFPGKTATWGGYPHMPMMLSTLNIIFQYLSLFECVSESVTFT